MMDPGKRNPLPEIDYAMTQQEVADALGITKQGVSYIEKTALAKLRKLMGV